MCLRIAGGLAVVLAGLAFVGVLGQEARGRYYARKYAEAEPVRTLDDFEARLRRAVAASELLSLDELGRVRYGEFSAALWHVAYEPGAPKRRVLVVGGVHGNEPAGALSALGFVEELSARPERHSDTAYDVIPLLNPWGWVHDLRGNAEARDLNRDFARFRTQEAQGVRRCCEGKEYELVLDHHEDSSTQGFYLYDLGGGSAVHCRRVLDAMRERDYPIDDETWMVVFRVRDGRIAVPPWGLRAATWAKWQALGNSLRLDGAAQGHVIETPSSLSLETRLDMHRLARDVLLEGLGE